MFASRNQDRQSAQVDEAPKEMRIGIWGPPRSGKTHYIAMLYHDILGRDGLSIQELSTSNVTESSDDNAYKLDDKLAYASDLGDRFRSQRVWLPRTDPAPANIKTYNFRISRSARTDGKQTNPAARESLVLSLTDAGGEWYRHPRTMRAKFREVFSEKETIKDPIQLLAECDGIICLFDSNVGVKGVINYAEHSDSEGEHPRFDAETIDIYSMAPDMRPLTRDELPGAFRELARLITQIRGRDEVKLEQPVAACVSKIDHPEGLWARKEVEKDLQDWVKANFGEYLLMEINNHCLQGRVKWFGISVLQNGSTTEDNRIMKDATIRPYHLYEPIGWLASVISGKADWNVS